MIFRRKKAEARTPTNQVEVAARAGYIGLRRALDLAIRSSRFDGRNPSIVLLGRIQHDILQARLDEQWDAYEKAGVAWKETPPVFSATNGMYFRGLRVVLVADANLLQVFEGTGDWK